MADSSLITLPKQRAGVIELVSMQRSKGVKSQAEKLKELEMSGLVDFTEEHARQCCSCLIGLSTAASQCANLPPHCVATAMAFAVLCNILTHRSQHA